MRKIGLQPSAEYIFQQTENKLDEGDLMSMTQGGRGIEEKGYKTQDESKKSFRTPEK